MARSQRGERLGKDQGCATPATPHLALSQGDGAVLRKA